MKIQKKLATTVIGVLVGLTGLLAGCGQPASSSPPPAAPVTAPAAIAKTGTLLIGSGLAYPPMEFFNTQHQPAGVDVKLGEAIAQEMGVKAQWVQITFDGLIPALNANRIDMIMADMNITPQRAQVVNFVPYFTDGSSIMVSGSNPLHIKTLADLSGKTVAVQLGTTLQAAAVSENQVLSAAGKTPISILTFPEATDAMDQLSLGRVQAVLVSTSVGEYYAHLHPHLFSVLPPFAPEPVGIAIKKSDPALFKAVSKAVKLMKADGQFKKIESQYLGS